MNNKELNNKLEILNNEFQRINELNNKQKANYIYILFYNCKCFKNEYKYFNKYGNSIKFNLSIYGLEIHLFENINSNKERLIFINIRQDEAAFIDMLIENIKNTSDIKLNDKVENLISQYIAVIKLAKSTYRTDIKLLGGELAGIYSRVCVVDIDKIGFFDFKDIDSSDCIALSPSTVNLSVLLINYKKLYERKKLINSRRKLMKKIWSIATAVRNPDRLRNFLMTLKEMEGYTWDFQAQEEFQARLVKNRLYGYSNTQFYSTLSQATIQLIENLNHQISLDEAFLILREKNYQEGFAIRGRTSYKALEKVGLAFIKNGKIEISSLGNYFLSDNYDIAGIFFKSFLKWQYPNPESRDFNDSKIYNIKPFIGTLHLINEVNKLCDTMGIKAKGISRQEFMVFGQSLLHYKDIKSQAEKIIDFRVKLEALNEKPKKEEFVAKYVSDFLKDFDNVTDGNLHDYADNTIRYFRLTRYITVRGGGFYIDLEPRRNIEIQKLLESDNASAKEFNKIDYIEYMSDINLPILPWETPDELLSIYEAVSADVYALEMTLGMKQKEFVLENQEILYLKSAIEELRTYRHKLLNIQLKKETADIAKIDETIIALTNIRKHDIKASIALEKYITIAFNIINDAKEIKPNSILSDDNDFIFTAPANKPDIECFYGGFNSVCEVTMLTNRDQWHNEGQPVMRHFRDFENVSGKEDNYCIFIAPAMHRDTINTFWISVKYEYEGKKQKIIPLTILQIIQILEVIKELKTNDRQFLHMQFKKLLDEIINIKEQVNNSEEWLQKIPNILEDFKNEFLCA